MGFVRWIYGILRGGILGKLRFFNLAAIFEHVMYECAYIFSEYTCFARNFYGKAASSAILQVVGVESNTTRSFVHDTRSSSVTTEKCVPICFSTGIIGNSLPTVFVQKQRSQK